MPPVTLPFDQTGLYTLVLEAHNGDLVSTAAATVEVRPLVTMSVQVVGLPNWSTTSASRFRSTGMSAEPGNLTARYNIWLESPNQPDPLLTAPLPLAGQQQVQIIPQEGQAEWLVTLYAQGQDDVTASVTQTLPIVYPSCELSVARTVVRSGPAEVLSGARAAAGKLSGGQSVAVPDRARSERRVVAGL